MIAELENYYLKQPEPIQGCLLALRRIILAADNHITEVRKYQVPFFYYKDKGLSFLWVNRKKLLLGFVTDKAVLPPTPGLKRKDSYEMIQIDPNQDIPLQMIRKHLKLQMKMYDNFK